MSRGGHDDDGHPPRVLEASYRDPLAEQEARVAELRRNRRSVSAAVALLSYATPPEARRLVCRMARCGQRRCRLMSCPRCGRRAQRDEVRRAMRDLYARMEGRARREALTYVTIKPALQVRVSLRTAALALKKRIRYLHRQHLASTAWSGFLEVGLVHADLHLHVVIYHPELSRAELSNVLKDEFSEDREVSVSTWDEDQAPFENLLNVFRYSTKHLPSTKGLKEHMVSASRLFGHYVVNRQRLSDSFVGVRFKINMRTEFQWRAGVLSGPSGDVFVDPDMEEFIWAIRGQRRRHGH